MSENNKDLKKGGISVETEHIFPIIKRWLYSEKDIFLREIVSNASDAITKLKRLSALGHIDLDEETEKFSIKVTVNKGEGTLTVEDNGIGMSEDELQKYICQIALSGALDFINKYENEPNADSESGKPANGIIGHFGLGFYSSFMVSDTVEIITKSYTDAPAVHWTCTEAGEYEIESCDKETRGTTVIMHVSDDEKEYLEGYKIRSVLNKYCAFMPVDIYLEVVEEDEHKHADGHDSDCECEECHSEPSPINDKYPLWQRPASECTPEMYNEFYHKVFNDPRDPLFYIHINADYPLNFKGILYFPRYNNEYESIEGQVKLYYNQVFVADDIKDVIPEYLLMLKGVLDCPELPLNVSRSYLQNNTYVKKVGAHIVKKVADKLNSMCNTDREGYEKVWDDIHIFVEFAYIRDQKFCERIKPSILLRLTDKKFATIDEYLEKAKETHENTIYYTNDVTLQSQYISLFNSIGADVAIFDKPFETQFITSLEGNYGGVRFVRVDSDVADILKNTESTTPEDDQALTDLFRKVSGNEKLTVKLNNLKDKKVPAFLTASEDARRMDEFMKMYARAGIDPGADAYPIEYTLSLNKSAKVINTLTGIIESDPERANGIASYIYKLALLASRRLSPEEMQSFLVESFDIVEKL